MLMKPDHQRGAACASGFDRLGSPCETSTFSRCSPVPEAQLWNSGMDASEPVLNPSICAESQVNGDGEKGGMEPEQPEKEDEPQQRSKRGSEVQPMDQAAHMNKSKDRCFKSHVAEGTEHLYRTHMCPECRRCFKKRTHLLEHLHLHFPDPGLQCPTCRHHFTSKSKLRIHLLRESGQKPHRCHLCTYSAVERNSLHRHLASVHGGEGGAAPSDVYPCPTCGEVFLQSQALKAHMKAHRALPAGRQPLACFQEGCPFRGADRRALQRHVRETHGVEAVECRYHTCGAFFGSREDMEAHRRTHLAFHCPHCNFSSSNKSSFQRHKRQGHAGPAELRCAFCPFTTFNPVEFSEHMGRLHANEKTHRCPQCEFVTAHKRVLGRHMLLHTGEKPHKCKLCDFRCRDETYLSKHMLTHSSDKNHMCSECGYVTKWKHYLNVHMRKHAGDLRYQCDQCPYRCHRSDQLSSHKLRHQDKSLICEVCAFSCKRKYELRRHMQLKHGGGEQQVPLFQCRYCPYSTRYRQALHNHENCRHTRHREFRCALCPYVTFSSTSLFLHKRKVHGYMPGDKAWLENYAKKEREQGGTTRGFPEKWDRVMAGDQQVPSEAGEAPSQLEGSLQIMGGSGENEMTADATTFMDQESETGTEGADSENRVGTNISSCQVAATDGNDGECCLLVLTSIVQPESMPDTCMPGDVESRGLSSLEMQLDLKAFPDAGGSPMCLSQRQSEDDQEGALVGDSEGQSNREKSSIPKANASDHMDGAGVDSSCSESHLTVQRRQDKEQADALVLEGHVQMLVMEAKARVHQCDFCAFATYTEAALAQHRRVSCRARRTVLRCKDCGAIYKQQRGLDTHRLRKCPVLLKMGRRFPVPAGLRQPEVSDQLSQDQRKVDHIVTGAKDRGMGPLSEEAVTEASEGPERRGMESSIADIHIDTPEHERDSNMGETHAAGKQDMDLGETDSVPLPSGTVEGQGYSKAPSQTRSSAENEDGVLGEGSTEEQDSRKIMERMGLRFFCPSCPFACHQERALNTHRRRGCLKPGDIQCQSCSFVARSRESLERHIMVHPGQRLSSAPQCRKALLQCKLCPFTCKQARCMTQHVSLKHEGMRPHCCRFCAFSTTRRYRLDAHESLHTGVGRLACRLCNHTFGTASKLQLHQQRVHDRQPTHFCTLCDYGGYSSNDVARHNLSCHTGELKYACDLCAARFSSNAALKQHCRRQHRDPGNQPCPRCDFMGRSQATLVAHLRQQHPRLECTPCGTEFLSREALEEHRRTHLTQRCPACPFAARGRQLLAQHLLDEHEDGFPEDKPLKCAACDFTCRHQLVFEQHVRSHGGTRLYRCTNCQYSTRNRQKITWHIRIHTGEKPYRCEHCGYTCADPSRLKYHMRIHQDERKYLCPDCGYKCKWVNQLKYHMTKHTGAKPYACEECEYRTNRADALRVHRETRHRDIRAFICEKCGKGFKTRFLLRTHLRRHSNTRPYVCRLCRRAFRWPAGLRHHFLTHLECQPFFCRHCSYRARQRFQVVKHLRRHHPEQPSEQGVGQDPGPHSVSLHEARLGEEEQEGGSGEKREQEGGPREEQEQEDVLMEEWEQEGRPREEWEQEKNELREEQEQNGESREEQEPEDWQRSEQE
nr:zinc finger protein 142 isoform X1 [Paramormyrops kingsleyae]